MLPNALPNGFRTAIPNGSAPPSERFPGHTLYLKVYPARLIKAAAPTGGKGPTVSRALALTAAPEKLSRPHFAFQELSNARTP